MLTIFHTNFVELHIFFVVAEKFLEGVEVNQNYPLLLLNLVHKPDVDMTIRIAGAIGFKNYIKRNWQLVSWCLTILNDFKMMENLFLILGRRSARSYS